MIPKHIPRKPENDNYRALALYTADAKINGESGEKTLMSWHEGCLAEDYLSGMMEVEATQAMNTRSKKEKTYHLMVSFRPEDEAKLSPETFKAIEKELAGTLGFSDHQRHCGVHKNTDNMHMHIAYNMINPHTFNRHAPFYDHQKLHRTCRALETKYGLRIDKGIDDSKRENAQKKHIKAETIEAQTGQQSFFNFVIGQKEEILEILKAADDWKITHEKFLKLGLEIKPKGNGLVIKDRLGKHMVKASDINRSLSKSSMEKRLGPFIGVTQGQAVNIKPDKKYGSVPLHRDVQKDNLYAQFQLETKQRKAALEAIKERENEAYNSNKSKWDEKRKAIEKYSLLPAHKCQLLQAIKAKEEAELAGSRLKLVEEKKSIRKAIPYTSWIKFLQHHSALGNEVALTVLRSKKMKPEQANGDSNEKAQSGLDAVKQSKELQAAVLSSQEINQKHKWALVAIVKMRELISNKIGTKGVVIFTLKTGGTIRDTGTELHFSPNDPYAKTLTEKYARTKWNQRIIVVGNVCKLDNNRERRQGISR